MVDLDQRNVKSQICLVLHVTKHAMSTEGSATIRKRHNYIQLCEIQCMLYIEDKKKHMSKKVNT